MSKYEQLQKRKPKDFKRLIGVNETTFEAMIESFRTYENNRKKRLGIGKKFIPRRQSAADVWLLS